MGAFRGALVSRVLTYPYGARIVSACAPRAMDRFRRAHVTARGVPQSPKGLPGTLPTDYGLTGQRGDGYNLATSRQKLANSGQKSTTF